MESNDVVRALAALAQASRLGIFRALVQAGPTGLTPSDLSAHLDVAGNTLSFHLKELMYADLVSQERAGRNLIYRARFDHMQQVLSYLSDNCCQGGVCEVDSTGASALCSTP
jgi:DNA-binding transcriptional ArsR family regulator